jgi:hypothetical protein
MQDSDKLAIAAHLSVRLRRATGRVIDVEWLVRDRVYAREILQLALAQPDQAELLRWARKLDVALGLSPPATGLVPVLEHEFTDTSDSALGPLTSPGTLSTGSAPSTLDDSALDSRIGVDSRLDSRIGVDSRLGGDTVPASRMTDSRPQGRGGPRYAGQLR